MNKFAPGDLVRANDDYVKGKLDFRPLYVVESVAKEGMLIKIEGIDGWFSVQKFDLCESAAQAVNKARSSNPLYGEW